MPAAVKSSSSNPGVDVAAHALLEEIAGVIDRHATEPITQPATGAALPRLVLVRADDPQEPRGELFFPVMCLVVRGAKTVQFGSRSHTFRAGTFVVSAVDFAVTGHVREVPYRAVAVALRPRLLAELLQVATLTAVRQGPTFVVGTASPQVLDALARLVRLLDHPDDGAVLAEAAERELLYRVLQTDAGHALRQVALDGHLASRVEPAVKWLRDHLTDPLDISVLAEMSHLSESSLYRHFRAATGSTPLQFQKRLRLQEARKLLLVGETNAAGAAARVGYQSPTQFHREYTRLFGVSPGRDRADHLRADTDASTASGPSAAPEPDPGSNP